MSVELLTVCQIIRDVITEIYWLFLYNISHYVNESSVPFSAWIWTYRSTTHNIFCIRQIVEKKS